VAVIPLVEKPGAVFVPKMRLYVLSEEREVLAGPLVVSRRRGYHREMLLAFEGITFAGGCPKPGATSSSRWKSSDAAHQRGDAIPGVVRRAAGVEHSGDEAAAAGLVQYRVVQLRDYTHDKHHTVDDSPYGGGAGMVLRAEPLVEAVEDLKVVQDPIVLLSARGTLFTHDTAVRYSLGSELTLFMRALQGRRSASGGPYLARKRCRSATSCCRVESPAALCVVDAVVRLLPGALGDHESASSDSHYEGLLAPPSYTRPPSYRGLDVPDVLLSGDHDKIAAWRAAQAEASHEKNADQIFG